MTSIFYVVERICRKKQKFFSEFPAPFQKFTFNAKYFEKNDNP